GPENALWYTAHDEGKLGRISTTGAVNEYFLNLPANPGLSYSWPYGIAAGSDGALWIVAQNPFNALIARVTTSGGVTRSWIDGQDLAQISSGPDGALWIPHFLQGEIDRISTTGVFSRFPINLMGSSPISVAAGPDGEMWFSDGHIREIGRL